MSWRETQLQWYGGDTIQQDYDLEQFVIENQILSIKYIGDSTYLNSIIGKKSSSGQMCVYLVNPPNNHLVKLSTIVSICNQELNELSPSGFLYLSINKFILDPELDTDAVDDYDSAIYNYVVSNINATLIKYHSGMLDGGQRFNWVHPLTRFYFHHANSI